MVSRLPQASHEAMHCKYEARAQQEERSWANRITTPTPEPYTPILTDVEEDIEDASTGV